MSHPLGIDSSRHENNLDLGPWYDGEHQFLDDDHQKIHVFVPFVDFVENDVRV